MGRLRNWLDSLGPGLITGASDDDPSGIGTYAQAGASFGFTTLWTAWVTLIMMIAVQGICARIGLLTGRGLAGVLRRHYPRWLLFASVTALFIANTINVGADIGAIAYGLNLATGIPPSWLWLPIAVITLLWEILGAYRTIARVCKWLTLSLFAYVVTPFLLQLDWWHILRHAVIPEFRWQRDFLTLMVAIWGTTISPYLFFWQASMEAEENAGECRHPGSEQAETAENGRGEAPATDQDAAKATIEGCLAKLRRARTDVVTGMFFSNLVMFFIILTTGATLHEAGVTDIQTAQQAAEALRPLAGAQAYALFAGGLIGTGLLAVPVLAGSSAYAVAEAFGWQTGLNEPFRRAGPFYGVLALGLLTGAAMDYMGINPIKALFWTAVINGVAAPPLLVLIMLISNNERVMGPYVNGPLLNGLGWLTAVIMGLMAIGMLVTMVLPSP